MNTSQLGHQRSPFLGAMLASEFHPGVSYRIERVIGEGGTAVAFLATRFASDGEAPVVIKIILPRIVAESGDTAETIIKKEAVALGRLNERLPPTQSVVRLLDVGVVQHDYVHKSIRLPWLALEYVHGGIEGATLYDRVEYSVGTTRFAFDPERAARVIRNLADGLNEIHAVGVVHRDLTPGNVLCCGAGESELFKISDFGIARPIGLTATFGEVALGTPGYVAPEQLMSQDVSAGPHSDIFSLAAVIFYVLTGQHYFDARSPMEAYSAARESKRRSLRDIPTLCPELREQEVACQAIDLALSRASAFEANLRPQNARLFAASLMPWLGETSGSARPSRRWLTSMEAVRPAEPSTGSWTVRHPPGDDRLVLSAAWNSAGHCLAATTRGLAYWDGTSWAPARSSAVAGAAPRFVRRLSPSSWLVGGEGALLTEYARDGERELRRGHDSAVTFQDATPDLDDLAVVVGELPGSPPLLYGLVGKRWLKPLPVTQAAAITSLCRIDDERWLVVGRATHGHAFAALFSPLHWHLEPLNLPPSKALLACASRPERRLAIAVGAEGAVLQLDARGVHPMVLSGSPNLACVVTDTLGREWAGSAGRLWVRRLQGDWACVWHNPQWTAPFVSMMAEVGFVAAMTVDGAMIECHADTTDRTRVA
jgi:serine/threonine protein kinase